RRDAPPRQGCDRLAADPPAAAESEGERELAGGRSGGVAGDDREQAERVDFCDPRQAEGREREGCDDTACAHRIVVRVEPVQGEPPDSVIGGEIVVASDRKPRLALVASEEGDRSAVRREAIARAGLILETERRVGRADANAPLRLRGCDTGE